MTNEIDMRVGMDVAQAKAELESLKRSVSGFVNEVRTTANGLRINVNAQFDDAAARAAIESFRNGLRGETVRVAIDVSGVVGAQSALDGVRNAVLGLGAATATTLPVLRDYNDELNRMQLAARAAADEIRRAAAEQERLRRAGGGNGGGGNGGSEGGADNDGSVWRKHALAVAGVAQEYSHLSARLLVVKSAMAVLTASIAGAIPVLGQMAAVGGMAMATFASTAHIAGVTKEMQSLSQATGMTTQSLRELQLLSGFEGVSRDLAEFGEATKMLEGVNARILEIMNGGAKMMNTKTAKFKELLSGAGVSVEDVKGKRPDEVLMMIDAGLAKTGKGAREVRQLFENLAGEGVSDLIPLLQKQNAELEIARQYMRDVGAIQTDAQVEAMTQTNKELSLFKIGLEGVATRLSVVGSNVTNTLAPNIRQLFIDAKKPIAEWSNDVDKALKKFKTDLDNTGSWTIAIKLSLKDAYPTLYGFVASAADFGRGYGQAFITPMLNELKRGYASIRGALGEAGGAENVGKGLGEAMLPVVGIVHNVVDAVKLLIVNWDQLKTIASYTPVGFVVSRWDKVTAAFAAVGNGIKTVAGYFGLLNPATLGNVSGMQMFTATLLGLAAAGASTRLALGALGVAFSVIRFAIAPVILAVQVAPAVFGALATAAGVAGRALQVLALAARLNPIVAGITAVAAVATVLITNWDKVAPFFSSLWTGVKGSFDRAFKGISDVPWYQVPAKILLGFASLAGDLYKTGVRAIAELAQGILVSLGMPESKAKAVKEAAINVFIDFPSRMIALGNEAMAKLADAVMDAGKQVVANMREMVSNAMQAGRDAVAGLAKGITDGSEKLGKAVRDLVGVVDSGVTDELEIQSPSRVMMRYGGFVAEGLAIGITAKGLQAVDSARVLSAKITNALKVQTHQYKNLGFSDFSSFDFSPKAANDSQQPKTQSSQLSPINPVKSLAASSLAKDLTATANAYKLAGVARADFTKQQLIGVNAQRQEVAMLEQARASGGWASYLQNMTSEAARQNKTMFEINKAAAVANALINTREAVTSAYKFGARFGGPVTGAAMAAVALAAQMANVKAIASQSFGGGGDSGGGSSSSGGGSSSTGAGSGGADAASSTSTQQSTAKTVTIALEGGDNSSYSKKQVRELIKQINDAVGDGARLRVA
jgi:hypothetical protein